MCKYSLYGILIPAWAWSKCTDDWSSWFNRLMFHSWESTLQISYHLLPFKYRSLALYFTWENLPTERRLSHLKCRYEINFLPHVGLHLRLCAKACCTQKGVTTGSKRKVLHAIILSNLHVVPAKCSRNLYINHLVDLTIFLSPKFLLLRYLFVCIFNYDFICVHAASMTYVRNTVLEQAPVLITRKILC